LLAYSSILRVYTLGQASRLVCQGNVARTEQILEELIHTDHWLARLDGIKLPKSCGGGTVSVYYLTARGADVVSKVDPEIYTHARPGKPKGAIKSRIPHELLVAEAYLWLSERYEILAFWPETELKSRIAKARVKQAGRRLKKLPNESTGDFEALIKDQQGSRWLQCEIAVRYKYKQIAVKPHDMLWFTCDERQADLIEKVKGSRPVMLIGVNDPIKPDVGCEPEWFWSANRYSRKVGSGYIDRVLRALDRLGGAATAEALSCLMGGKRTNISHCLKMLAEAGTLLMKTAQLNPGSDSGRPATLYLRPQVDASNIGAKARILTLSYTIVLVDERGYRLHSVDHNNDFLECRHRVNSSKEPLLLTLDNPEYPANKTHERLRIINSRAAQIGAIAAAIAADPIRIARLKVLAPTLNIVDIGRWKITHKRK
jgi:hypothetical protein